MSLHDLLRRWRAPADPASDKASRDNALIDQVSALIDPVLRRYFSAQVTGLERIPEGPVLYVGNHSGGVVSPDTWIFCAAVCRQRGIAAVPFGLIHDLVTYLPRLEPLARRFGCVPASAQAAENLLAAGHKVLVYPGGDVEVFRPFRDRHRITFGGRQGYIRVALRAGVPIVPVVSAGSHATFFVLDDLRWLARLLRADKLLRVHVWPLSFSLPWGLFLGPTPPFIPLPVPIQIEVLPPISFARSGNAAAQDAGYVRACAETVEGTMQAALDRLAARR